MSAFIPIFLWIGLGCSALLLVYWLAALWRTLRTRQQIPNLRAGLALAQSPLPLPRPLVHIIVPAHNEAACIAPLIASIRAIDTTHADWTLTLALDRCTDNTEAVASRAIGEDARCTILMIDRCPEDWAGKVHAVHQALAQSAGPQSSGYNSRYNFGHNAGPRPFPDWLLFVDADTTFDPACLTAAISLAQHRHLDLLTLLSTLTHDRWFERITQPAAGLELVRQFPLLRVNRPLNHPGGRRAFANGQFMLFRARIYETLAQRANAPTAHAAVKDHLLEDLALARATHDAGGTIGLFLADGLFRCRMYDSPRALRDGWMRIFIEAAKRKPTRLRQAAAIAATFGVWLPAIALATAVLAAQVHIAGTQFTLGHAAIAGGLALAALAAMLFVLALAYAMGRTPLWAILFYPFGAWQTARILRRGARTLERRTPIRWAGRDYILEPRPPH
jgi:glycosyltransferase involved in cell wall biosynthesis